MKKKRLFLSAICLLLVAASGCARKPVNAVMILPASGNAVYPYVEEGGKLEFIEENQTDEFTLSFPNGVCQESSPITSHALQDTNRQSATCHVIETNPATYAFSIQVKPHNPNLPPPPPMVVQAYIRPCPPGCKLTK